MLFVRFGREGLWVCLVAWTTILFAAVASLRADIYQLRGEATIRSFGQSPPSFGQIGERISIAVDLNSNSFHYQSVPNEAFHIFDTFSNFPIQIVGETSGVFPAVEPITSLNTLELTDDIQTDLLYLEGIGNDVLEYRCQYGTCFDGRIEPFNSNEVFDLLHRAITDAERWRLPTSIPSLQFTNGGEAHLEDVSWTVNVLPSPAPTHLDIVAAADAQFAAGANPNLNTSGTSIIVGQTGPELRALLEFPLAVIPAGAELERVQLELDGFVSSGEPVLEVVAYQGNGSITAADITAAGNVVANTLPMSLGTGLLIDLNVATIQTMLGNGSHLGLRLRGLSGFDYVGFLSTESASAGPKPSLLVRYIEPAIAGDFDEDGDVDGRDFLVWQRNTSVGDLADWRANYGGGELVASIAAPEPGGLVISGAGLLIALARPLKRPRLF